MFGKLPKTLGLIGVLMVLSLAFTACSKSEKKTPEASGPVVIAESFLPTDTDFKTQITKLKGEGVDAIFVNPQTPPKADLILKQLQEQGVSDIQLFGNDVVLGYREGISRYAELTEGMIGAETVYNETHPDTVHFVKTYKELTGETEIPYITYAATCFDAVRLIKEGVTAVGNNAASFKDWLYKVDGWKGSAGSLTIDKNGDPTSGHTPKIVKNGKVVKYGAEDSASATETPADTEEAVEATIAAKGETVKIGGILPLTGDGAAYGVPLQKVAQIAIDKVNSEGGIQLEFIWEDGKCNGQDGSAAAQKLIDIDKVQIIYGGFCSSETLGAAPIAEQAGIVMLSPGSSSPDITNAGDFIFRNYPSDSSQGVIMAGIATELGLKKVGMLTEENDYTVGIEKVFKEAFEVKTK